MQILVAKDWEIIYNKQFGNYTYDANSHPVEANTYYDLASLTKILATLPIVMKMYEDGKLYFHQTLGEWLPEFLNTDLSNITIKELLLHESGLPAWIPFYKNTMIDGKLDDSLYCTHYSEDFPIEVSDSIFLRKDYPKQMLESIKHTRLEEKKYKYSDLNFILLQEIIQKCYGKNVEEVVTSVFYKPLGIQLMFNPYKRIEKQQIAPTEIDDYYRHTIVQGYVHDMGAAMFGGVAGHAGLFGTANDVYRMMQFFIDASRGESTLLSAKTLMDFNTCYSCDKGNRRGAGFDKPQLKGNTPTCGCLSMDSFGHTGFTGTFAWADPKNNLVYIFLSNRTYPSSKDNKLAKFKVRERIQQVIYESFLND